MITTDIQLNGTEWGVYIIYICIQLVIDEVHRQLGEKYRLFNTEYWDPGTFICKQAKPNLNLYLNSIKMDHCPDCKT